LLFASLSCGRTSWDSGSRSQDTLRLSQNTHTNFTDIIETDPLLILYYSTLTPPSPNRPSFTKNPLPTNWITVEEIVTNKQVKAILQLKTLDNKLYSPMDIRVIIGNLSNQNYEYMISGSHNPILIWAITPQNIRIPLEFSGNRGQLSDQEWADKNTDIFKDMSTSLENFGPKDILVKEVTWDIDFHDRQKTSGSTIKLTFILADGLEDEVIDISYPIKWDNHYE
jgi:hypothetical protein